MTHKKAIKTRDKVGRPKIDIDWEEVGKYLEAGSPGTAIASMFGMSSTTLYQRCEQENGCNFHEFSQEKRCKGDERLRAKQYHEAMKGDRGMMIWLGKQRLAQKDKHDYNHSGNVTNNVTLYGDRIPKTWKEENKEIEKDDG